MTQLYKIANSFKDVEGLDDMSEDVIADTLEGIQLEFDDKAENIIALVKNLGSTSNALKVEAESLTKRRKSIDNKISSLSNYLLSNMQVIDCKKVEIGPHIATIRKGREIVIVDNVDDLPDSLVNVKTELVADKIAIMSAYKATGLIIAGAHVERKQPTLTIK